MTQIEKLTSVAISELKLVAETYSEASGTKLTALSHRILNSSSRFKHLFESGGDLNTRQQEKCMQWFSDNWPLDLDWPAGIDRPVPSGPPAVEAAE